MDDKKGSLKEEIKDVMYDIDTIINDKNFIEFRHHKNDNYFVTNKFTYMEFKR